MKRFRPVLDWTLAAIALSIAGCASATTSTPATQPLVFDDRPAALRRYNPAFIHRLELQAIELAVGTDTGCDPPVEPRQPHRPMRCTVIENEFGEPESMSCD